MVAMTTGQNYELTRRDYIKDRALQRGAMLSPVLLGIPLPIVFLVLFAVFGTSPAWAAFYLFFAVASLVGGFVLGILLMIMLFIYRNNWLKNLREQLAVDGIKTAEVDWFKNEMTSAERKSLKEIEKTNRLLAGAFRETLASRLTATRILKSTKDELLLVQRRQNKLKYLQNENSKSLQEELQTDAQRLERLKKEAEELRIEAETRLQMIEAAARRGTSLVGNEAALQRLTERTAELPMALQAAKIEEEIRREFEREDSLAEKSNKQITS